ncbi:hypothetical protein [Cellulomonas sp. 73-92]|uniref:hypothetical protein n=1 Tax=Cellulomonas sp. 73-92 TaxID=1895740 RepID=UPI0025B7E4D1|nr:hypothetical protein [Cellulomonas sp. 73-92]
MLPATDAARIDGSLEATARAARAAGDRRTLDQLRADTLTDLATGTALLAGTTATGTALLAGTTATGTAMLAGATATGTALLAGATLTSGALGETLRRGAAGTSPVARHGEAHSDRPAEGITCDAGTDPETVAAGVVITDGDAVAASRSVPSGATLVPRSEGADREPDLALEAHWSVGRVRRGGLRRGSGSPRSASTSPSPCPR